MKPTESFLLGTSVVTQIAIVYLMFELRTDVVKINEQIQFVQARIEVQKGRSDLHEIAIHHLDPTARLRP